MALRATPPLYSARLIAALLLSMAGVGFAPQVRGEDLLIQPLQPLAIDGLPLGTPPVLERSVELTSSSATTDTQAPVSAEVLDGRTIACSAARNWIPSKALRARGATIVQAYQDQPESAQQAACALNQFLNMQATHQQDIGAASALRAYYTRIAIAEQLQLADDSQHLVEDEKAKQQAVRQGGLAAVTDLSAFDRRRLEIEDQRLQLLSQDRQLRTLLAQLALRDYGMHAAGQERLDVRPHPLDCARLQQLALAGRCDLRGWTYLWRQTNETSAPEFAKIISTVVGGFGLPLPTMTGLKMLLCPPDTEQLADNMRRELSLTVETHRRWICQAVEEKCAKLHLAYQRIELAQQTIASWNERLKQLEQVEQMGKPDPEQLATARIGWMTARAEEIARRLDARSAEIDLAESLGGLCNRCCSGQAWLLTGHEAPEAAAQQ